VAQIWLVTHSQALAAALAEHGAIDPRIVIKREGETWMEGLRLLAISPSARWRADAGRQ